MGEVPVRRAVEADEAALLQIELTAWDGSSGFPSLTAPDKTTLFSERSGPDAHLVAEVHGTNAVARRLYERHGYVVEGTHPREFLIEGQYVDSLDLAKFL
ncbi:GNAT family N-acetyltransferase [Kribbella catacumbae]|uniref:GNAT family N-acetyltransferase n=1 Tax=Kribbella catacumbae TaxID=460086 RepID=UPI00037D5CDF|nr:GNAT family protein [Kribbella catacumbae]